MQQNLGGADEVEAEQANDLTFASCEHILPDVESKRDKATIDKNLYECACQEEFGRREPRQHVEKSKVTAVVVLLRKHEEAEAQRGQHISCQVCPGAWVVVFLVGFINLDGIT